MPLIAVTTIHSGRPLTWLQSFSPCRIAATIKPIQAIVYHRCRPLAASPMK